MDIREIRIISGADKDGNPEGVEEIKIISGDILIIAGPTGSGKSQLLSDLEQLADGDSPSGRRVLVNGNTIDPFSARITARLSQNMHFVMDLDVGSFIELHAGSRGIAGNGIVGKVISLSNELAGEAINTGMHLSSLSGGQSRALMIADAAVISNAPVVLIDEIENAGIDKTKGIRLLSTEGKMVLIATHDPTIMLTAPRRVVMKNGAISKIIQTSSVEKENLGDLVKIDSFLGGLRQKLRQGEQLNKNAFNLSGGL